MSYIVQGHTTSNCGAKSWTWTIWYQYIKSFYWCSDRSSPVPYPPPCLFFVAYIASILSISLLESQKIRMQQGQEKRVEGEPGTGVEVFRDHVKY